MTTRPKWMPSDDALTSMEYHCEEALRLGAHRNTHDALRAFARSVGLRAQIAILETLMDSAEWLPTAMGGEREELFISQEAVVQMQVELAKELAK